MKIVSTNQPSIPTQPDAAHQSSSSIGNQTINTEPANLKSAEKPSADAARETLVDTAVTNKANLPKQPFDDRLTKGLVLDRLGCGNNPKPHPYNTYMENDKVGDGEDGGDDVGSDFPAEDKDVWDKNRDIPGFDAPSGTGWSAHGTDGGSDDNSGRQVGISLSHPSRLEGDGRVRSETTGTTTSTQSNTSSATGSSTIDTTSTTPVHHHK